MGRRKQASLEAMAKYHADVGLAKRFDDLFAEAQEAEQALREAQATRAPDKDLHRLGMRLDGALTDVMRAAYAAQRAEIGPLGHDDRIYRRKAMATPKVRAWTMEAERLLTLRESHRLTGIVRLPQPLPPDPTAAPGGPFPGATGSSDGEGVLPHAASVS